jgi:putative glycosyltransferase
MKLSIVATLYQSAPYVNELWERSSAVARQLAGDDYEIVFVNDGSPDNSLDLAISLAQKDAHVVVVDLSRNFGHHKAMMTGLAESAGELVYLIDADLEEEPEWLTDFASLMQREHCDVVYGVQAQRKGAWFERWSGRVFYRLMRLLGEVPRPEDWVTASLMTRRYVTALLRHEERALDIGGLFVITGFEQRKQLVNKGSHSPTTYNFAKKLELAVNSIASFTAAPLIAIFYFGAGISLVSFGFSTYVILQWLFSKPMSGWTSVITSIWLLGGLIIFFIGVVGIYLSKIFLETKRRPLTIIREIYGKQKR